MNSNQKKMSYPIKLILSIAFSTLLSWGAVHLIAWLFGGLFDSEFLDVVTNTPYFILAFGLVFGVLFSFAKFEQDNVS